MTTYFAAPDGHGHDTLWVEATGDDVGPLAILRRCDLSRGQQDHWDEIVARVVAGDLSATEQWALDKAARRNEDEADMVKSLTNPDPDQENRHEWMRTRWEKP